MKHYIGNINSVFDCEQLIYTIKNVQVDTQHGHMTLPPDNPFYQEYVRQTSALELAGYDEHVVEYRHYQAGEHFDYSYAEKFAEFVGANPLMCWISEIYPGKCTPWHNDINPWEHEHLKLGSLVRYFMFLSKPAPGHIFVTETDCYYNEVQGSVYQYEHIHSFHAGSNVGLIPKYLLTFTGYKTD